MRKNTLDFKIKNEKTFGKILKVKVKRRFGFMLGVRHEAALVKVTSTRSVARKVCVMSF